LRSAHDAFVCFTWILEKTAIVILSLYSINSLVIITDVECLLRDTNWVL